MSTRAIVPVKISLTDGDFYTLWAPKWRENGSEWEAFLGDDTHILAFHSPEELLSFIDSNHSHDLVSHPAWKPFAAGPAGRVLPGKKDYYDIIGAPEYLAGRASYENVSNLAGVFEVARALAEVGSAEEGVIFFASHSVLRNVQRGAEHYSGPQGEAEWTTVGHVVLDNWKNVVESIDEVVRVVDTSEFDESARTEAAESIAAAQAASEKAAREEEERRAAEREAADPYDRTGWAATGIDPIKISIQGESVYSLRTYLGNSPVFLGSYGEIKTFPTSKQLLRWIIENSDHDLARVSTWDDLVSLANAGELEVVVHADNNYSFAGISEAILEGPEAVDTEQMSKAYELMADAADWSKDDSLNSYLLDNPRFQDYLSYMLGGTESSGYVPSKPYNDKAQCWKDLEDMLIGRFSKF